MRRRPYGTARKELCQSERNQLPAPDKRLLVIRMLSWRKRLGKLTKRKKFIKDLGNPQILTLDEAFALRDQTHDPEDWSSNQDPDGRVVDAVLDRIGCRFSGPHNIAALSYGERLILEVTALMGEVLNGGFHQYLWNSSGDSAEQVKAMLGDIGAAHTFGMLDRVSEFFPDRSIPVEREERCRVIEELENENPEAELFVEEDRAFYKSEENLYKLLGEYIANHRDEFAEPADDIVRRLKRQQRIREHLGVEDDPAALEEAEEALRVMETLADEIQTELRQEQLSMIRELLAKGQKKEAIKAYRSAFDCSLSDAKAAVEEMMQSQ